MNNMNKWDFRALTLCGIGALLFLACNKEPDWDRHTTWAGTVRMLGTEEPIPDIKLKLYSVESSGGFLGGDTYTLLEEQYSDSMGQFSFSYVDIESMEDYVIIPEADYYFINDETRGTRGEHVAVDVIMHPYAWVRVRVKNVPPSAVGNRLYIGGLNGIGTGFFNSSILDTVVIGYLRGNASENYFRYTIYESSIDQTGIYTLLEKSFPALDTSDVSIEF